MPKLLPSSLPIKLALLAVFAALAAGIWWYQLEIARPKKICLAHPGATWESRTRTCRLTPETSCEAGGGWWDPMSKSCAKVINVPAFTGKPVKGSG